MKRGIHNSIVLKNNEYARDSNDTISKHFKLYYDWFQGEFLSSAIIKF